MFRCEIDDFRVRVSEVEFLEEVIWNVVASVSEVASNTREITHLDYSLNPPQHPWVPIVSIPVYA